ncbi:ATP-binding protein [Streptomyces sp. NPDC091289]|uniref:ATP-binding protein n=1 Tax=Streptomyces sp. NPDC091289 TaxID=3365989 RepID=UPI0037F8B349
MTVAQPNAIGSPGYTAEVPCVRESVSRARALVSHVLAVWGTDDDATGYGKVIVTELLANAVEHTDTPVSRVLIERPGNGAVHIGVSDRSHDVPHLKTTDLNAESSRGLSLVAAMSSRWGYETHPWGKVTWAAVKASAGRTQ